LEKERIIKIYSRYSYIYDLIFSHMITPRIRSGLKKMGIKEGDLIIEAGVGTGLSLPLYPNFCRVVGIDITRKMLDKARIKKERFNLIGRKWWLRGKYRFHHISDPFEQDSGINTHNLIFGVSF